MKTLDAARSVVKKLVVWDRHPDAWLRESSDRAGFFYGVYSSRGPGRRLLGVGRRPESAWEDAEAATLSRSCMRTTA